MWENKKKLDAAKANLEYAYAYVETHRLAHQLENKQYYDQLEVRYYVVEEYKQLLSGLNNTVLLDKALALGQISVIQYFLRGEFLFYSLR